MKAMQQVAHIEVGAAGENGWFKYELLDRGQKMMTDSGDSEMQQREQKLEDAILRAAQASMPPGDMAELQRLVLGPHKKTFHRELTGEPLAQVEPMRLVWTPTARTTRAKPRLYALEKRAQLSEQM